MEEVASPKFAAAASMELSHPSFYFLLFFFFFFFFFSKSIINMPKIEKFENHYSFFLTATQHKINITRLTKYISKKTVKTKINGPKKILKYVSSIIKFFIMILIS